MARLRRLNIGAESHIPYPHSGRPAVMAIQRHYAGAKCAKGKGGWVCPHQKASLGSIMPIDGVITCPLHGLKIDAETGIVIDNGVSA